MPDSQKIHILIASEFSFFRRGIKSILENEKEINVVSEATDINGIFNSLQKSIPQLIILNLNLEAETLNSLCNNLHTKYPKLPILVFIEYSFDISLAELIVSGVRGVIWKNNSEDELTDIIRCVAGGSLYFEDPDNCRINCQLSQKTCNDLKDIGTSDKLSERENEILTLIAKGLSYHEIATQLSISSRTVETHKNNILSKLNLKNKYELIRFAIQNYNM